MEDNRIRGWKVQHWLPLISYPIEHSLARLKTGNLKLDGVKGESSYFPNERATKVKFFIP